MCTDEEVLSTVYKRFGKPGKRVLRDNIHWVPFKCKWAVNSAVNWFSMFWRSLLSILRNTNKCLIIFNSRLNKLEHICLLSTNLIEYFTWYFHVDVFYFCNDFSKIKNISFKESLIIFYIVIQPLILFY